MSLSTFSVSSIAARRRPIPAWPAPARHTLFVAAILLLLGAGTLLVYVTGGTGYAYPYLMLIPVLIAAALYDYYGGIITAIIAGLLVGPAMPLEVQQAIPQDAANWLLRLGLYVVIGGFAGVLFGRFRHMAKAREAAVRTATCGLLNQSALITDTRRALENSASTDASVALVLIQVADFTELLSGIGADAGDDLMRAIGQKLCRALDNASQVYRLGASELALLITASGEKHVCHVLDTIGLVGEETVVVHDVPVRAQLVSGITRTTGAECEPQELIRRVRVAVFEALEHHQPYCWYAPEYERDTAETIRLIAQVRHALAAGQFELHYQPKIRLSDGAVWGCEGLIRWRESENRLIAPGLFMPKVERTTLISPVTRFVTLQAFQFLRHQGHGPVSINFAVSNLFDEKLLAWLFHLVEDQQIEPHRLEIEITEGALIHDPEAAKSVLGRLKDAGVCVLLDDFGTGYSSFEHLRHLPISGLKIDRAFVKDLETDHRARKLMACMIEVAHALDVVVTAEGVETEGQAEILRELGCDLAQGFLYARPMLEQDYFQWLQGRHPQARGRA
jgi:EAL domain-containing protein (putative c-di-GMP-specific phosphodiesterase class I)/GGDEF domain-containing protein